DWSSDVCSSDLEMVEAFEIDRVTPNPAKFDLKKCQAINGEHIRMLDGSDLTERLIPYLVADGLLDEPPTGEQRALLADATPLVPERIGTLREAAALLRFLFVPDGDLSIDDKARTKKLNESGQETARAALEE